MGTRSDFVGGNHRKDNSTHFRRQGTSVIWGRGIAMVSVPSSHGTNAYSPFFEAPLCRINCLGERKGPCCSANLPHDLKPANTTRRYSSPDRIKRRPVKQPTTLRHPTMDLLLNKARVSGDCAGGLPSHPLTLQDLLLSARGTPVSPDADPPESSKAQHGTAVTGAIPHCQHKPTDQTVQHFTAGKSRAVDDSQSAFSPSPTATLFL